MIYIDQTVLGIVFVALRDYFSASFPHISSIFSGFRFGAVHIVRTQQGGEGGSTKSVLMRAGGRGGLGPEVRTQRALVKALICSRKKFLLIYVLVGQSVNTKWEMVTRYFHTASYPLFSSTKSVIPLENM